MVPGNVPVHLALLAGPVATVGAGVRAAGPRVHVVHVLLEAALGGGGEGADGAGCERRRTGHVHRGQVLSQDRLGGRVRSAGRCSRGFIVQLICRPVAGKIQKMGKDRGDC